MPVLILDLNRSYSFSALTVLGTLLQPQASLLGDKKPSGTEVNVYTTSPQQLTATTYMGPRHDQKSHPAEPIQTANPGNYEQDKYLLF